MTVVTIYQDERYPCPYVQDNLNWGCPVDVPQSLLDEWKVVDERWGELAYQLLDLLEKAEKKERLRKANETGQQSIGF